MFKEHLNHAKAVEPFVLVGATANEVYVAGEALTIGTAGTVTKCTGANVPQFICQEAKTAAAGDVILVSLVNPQQALEVPLSAAGTALKVGNKVTIATTGTEVTATTTDGVFLISEILGTAVGDSVRGYFMR